MNHAHSMDSSPARSPSVVAAARQYWRDLCARNGSRAATTGLIQAVWSFVRNSTPERQRRLYGDFDFDWEHRVNTMSGGVGWRERLLGELHSLYQPTEPAAFHEMMQTLRNIAHLDFSEFVFLDLGSGKGRTLMMASDYPFQRIIGVELLPGAEPGRTGEPGPLPEQFSEMLCYRIGLRGCEQLSLFLPLPGSVHVQSLSRVGANARI